MLYEVITPATNIKFEVPENSFVNLLIYDELGRLVTNLVNEHLKPGTYEVNWDASKYSSGIYYCKLITVITSYSIHYTKLYE